jgi:site-specific recombinase XerD
MNLSRFIRQKYGKEDIPFSQLEYPFIEDYDLYLKTEHGMKAGSVGQHIMFLRKSVRRAMNRGMLSCDPFFGYVPDQPSTMRKWLSGEELDKIMTARIEHPGIRFVRDMFVFSAFTGLSYIDIKNLREEQILTDTAGKRWISIQRQKTGTGSMVPLLDIPEEIIGKYRGSGEGGKVFRMLCMNVVCRYTKRMAQLCGLNRHLTFHMGRHTFATTVCLSHGVPIETVSRMLGHASIHTTQIYAEITRTKISEDLTNLEKRIEGKYKLADNKK